MNKTNQKGEGLMKTILILIILGGVGYAGYVYLWPMFMGSGNPAPQAASTEATPTPGEAKAGSMAGAAVQGAAAAGEIYGSGR